MRRRRASGRASIAEAAVASEGRGAFGGFVGPATLRSQVAVGAPYLFEGPCAASELGTAVAARAETAADARLVELTEGPHGWWTTVLAGARLEPAEEPDAAAVTDYFALCLAAHWASAPSYVPTDVDAKIRRALWRDQRDAVERERMVELVLQLERWDVRGFAARMVAAPSGGWISSHDGELLSVLSGALVDAVRRAEAGETGAEQREQALTAALDAELARQAGLLEEWIAGVGLELDLARAAAIATHNVGDVDQGLGVGNRPRPPRRLVERFGDLARRADGRYGDVFAAAAAVYREHLSAEGHRHYPLRASAGLRRSPALQLPVPPLLDEWGVRIAVFDEPGVPFDDGDRGEVVTALVDGVRRVRGQSGYQRALAGFEERFAGGFASGDLELPGTVRKALTKGELRKQLDVPRRSFESSLAKAVRRTVDRARR